MKRLFKGVPICILLLFLALVIGRSHLSGANTNTSDIFIINPGSPESNKYMENWLPLINSRYIYNWGRSRGLFLIKDRGPIIDNNARFISPFGSRITVTGLKRDSFYRMWIDFVLFKNPEGKSHTTKLKIFIGNPDSKNRLIRTLIPGDMKGRYCLIDIPYELSIQGSIDVVFREYTQANSSWGVWDIIISNKQELPDIN